MSQIPILRYLIINFISWRTFKKLVLQDFKNRALFLSIVLYFEHLVIKFLCFEDLFMFQ
jgi:hypothetical protein